MFKNIKNWWLGLIKEEYHLEVWFFNDDGGRTKKEFSLKSISKRTNKHIKAVMLDGTPLEIKTVEPFDFCLKKIY